MGAFRIDEEKRYQIALTKTGKLQFYKVTPFTDLEALEERRRKYWEAVTAVYAYSQQEARAKAEKEFKEQKELREKAKKEFKGVRR